MKRTVLLLLALVTAVTLCACGNSAQEPIEVLGEPVEELNSAAPENDGAIDAVFNDFYNSDFSNDSIAALIDALNAVGFPEADSIYTLDGEMSVDNWSVTFPAYVFDGQKHLDMNSRSNDAPNIALNHFMADVYRLMKGIAQHPVIQGVADEGFLSASISAKTQIKAVLYDSYANEIYLRDHYSLTYSFGELQNINWENMDRLVEDYDMQGFADLGTLTCVIGTFNGAYPPQWYLDNGLYED